MGEAFYVHLEFVDKGGKTVWSINLPFLCAKCGVCCTLENFLTAGKINDAHNIHTQIHAKFKDITEEIGAIFEQNPDKYDQYIASEFCPFLTPNGCSIYEIRPNGCRLYPYTKFGLQATDCKALTRLKKQKIALKKGKLCKETYHHNGTGLSDYDEPIKPSRYTKKQYNSAVGKLRQVGITDDELTIFEHFNNHCSI
jgi:Fe-S-cluster containining protein